MRKLFKSILVVLSFIAISNQVAMSQESEESSLSFGADLMSRYIWRGLNLGGNAASVQPWVELGIGNSGLSIGAWGAYSLGEQTNQEADLYVSYTIPNEMLSIMVTDYYFPDDLGGYEYFDYSNTTGHTFEAAVSFNGTESVPLSLMFAMNFAGADALNEDGDNVMSKYIELGYSTSLGNLDFGAFAGAALDKAPDGETGFYGQESAALVNLGINLSKEVHITERFSLPLSGAVITNPNAESFYIVFGVSF